MDNRFNYSNKISFILTHKTTINSNNSLNNTITPKISTILLNNLINNETKSKTIITISRI